MRAWWVPHPSRLFREGWGTDNTLQARHRDIRIRPPPLTNSRQGWGTLRMPPWTIFQIPSNHATIACTWASGTTMAQDRSDTSTQVRSNESNESAPGPTVNTQAAIGYDLFCPACGYNLRGLTDDRCPECGNTFDRATLHVSRIPWVHRNQLGRFRAYWQTVWLVITRPRQFRDEVLHPVSYRDAQQFRWITILHAYLPVLAGTVALYLFGSFQLFPVTVIPKTARLAQ